MLSWNLQSQGRTPAAPALTALDYIEIQQLVAKYPWAIDNCANNGYDYAELYVPDGMFTNSLSPALQDTPLFRIGFRLSVDVLPNA